MECLNTFISRDMFGNILNFNVKNVIQEYNVLQHFRSSLIFTFYFVWFGGIYIVNNQNCGKMQILSNCLVVIDIYRHIDEALSAILV